MSLQFSTIGRLSAEERLCDQCGGEVWLTRLGLLRGDLLTVSERERVVRWYAPGAVKVRRVFETAHTPLQAVFCYLRVSADGSASPVMSENNANNNISSAHTHTDTHTEGEGEGERQLGVAVLTDEDVLHLFSLSGEHREVLLPCALRAALSTPMGLVLEAREALSLSLDNAALPHNATSAASAASAAAAVESVRVSPDRSLFSVSPLPLDSQQKNKNNNKHRNNSSDKGQQRQRCKFFSLSSASAPLRLLTSEHCSLAEASLLAVYESLVVLFLSTSKDVAVFALSEVGRTQRESDAQREDERKRSFEHSLAAQSPFLDRSLFSQYSQHSQHSQHSHNSNNSQNSRNSQNSGSNASRTSLSFAQTNAHSKSSHIHAQTRRRSAGSQQRHSPPSPLDDSARMQELLLGTGRHSLLLGRRGERNLSGNFPAPSPPVGVAGMFSFSRTGNDFSGEHSPCKDALLLNSSSFSGNINNNNSSNCWEDLSLFECDFEELQLQSFHNETYFSSIPELTCVFKSSAQLAVEKDVDKMECRLCGVLNQGEGLVLNIFDAAEPHVTFAFAVQAEADELLENPWPVSYKSLSVSISSVNLIEVTGFKAKSVVSFTLSAEENKHTSIPLFVFHQNNQVNLAYTAGLDACYQCFSLSLNSDEDWVSSLVGLSPKNTAMAEVHSLQQISSANEFIAITNSSGTQIVKVSFLNHEEDFADSLFFEVFRALRTGFQACNLDIKSFNGFYLGIYHELRGRMDAVILVLLAATLQVPLADALSLLSTSCPKISLSLTQIIDWSYTFFSKDVCQFPEKESCAILSFGVLLLLAQEYRLQQSTERQREGEKKSQMLNQALRLVWALVYRVNNFQAQALSEAYKDIVLASEDYLTDRGLIAFIGSLSSFPHFEVLRRILAIPSMRSVYLSLSLTWHLLTALHKPSSAASESLSQSVREGSAEWARTIVNAFLSSAQFVFSPVDRTEEEGENANNTVFPDDESLAICLRSLPQSLRECVSLAMKNCQSCANPRWPLIVLQWCERSDLVANRQQSERSFAANKPATLLSNTRSQSKPQPQSKASKDGGAAESEEASDGIAEVIADSLLRFPEDERLKEASRMLRSSAPMYLKIERTPDMSEVDFRSKQQTKLLSLCRRSLALPIGRGMLTIASLEPLMAEALPIPPVSLQGRLAPHNHLVTLDVSQSSVDITLWSDFHNGVSAALRVGPKNDLSDKCSESSEEKDNKSGLQRITRNWIIYNKTAALGRTGGEKGHAGFLLGLGLFGHLNVLTIADICDYLTQGHEPTTIAMLVGVAASKLSSADALFSKTLCLHLPSLLPAQHWAIEISPATQCAAIAGLGLLYCRSHNRLMVQFLLEELTRRPSSDRVECRESLALVTAWTLGMVLLPKDDSASHSNKKMNSSSSSSSAAVDESSAHTAMCGEESDNVSTDPLQGLADLNIEDRLQSLIQGGQRPPQSSLFALPDSAYDPSAKSSRVLEGDTLNTDVTAPGAMLALAMIYWKSRNEKVLKRLALPQTSVELDGTRPDLFIFRMLARCLVLWEDVEPSTEYLENQLPALILKSLPSLTSTQGQSNAEKEKYIGPFGAARQNQHFLSPVVVFTVYLHILCGYCLGLGVVYAGTFNEKAKQTVLHYLKYLQQIRDNKLKPRLCFALDKTLRHMVEMCTATVAVSLSCIMAGSGDIDSLRTLRELRWKVDDSLFGTHLAFGMAIGMLFLGGGRYSLRRDAISVACLTLAIVPRFPNKTADQQHHLQALRHLYALCVEKRVLHTIDEASGDPVSVDLELTLRDGERRILRAPGLLPELSSLRSLRVAPTQSHPQRYFPCGLDVEKKTLPPALFVQRVLSPAEQSAQQGKTKRAGETATETLRRTLAPAFPSTDSRTNNNAIAPELHKALLNTLLQNNTLRRALLSAVQD